MATCDCCQKNSGQVREYETRTVRTNEGDVRRSTCTSSSRRRTRPSLAHVSGRPRPAQLDVIWAAAGTPDSVFPLAPADLLRVTGAVPCAIAAGLSPGGTAS